MIFPQIFACAWIPLVTNYLELVALNNRVDFQEHLVEAFLKLGHLNRPAASFNASLSLAMTSDDMPDEKAWLESAGKACHQAKKERRGKLVSV